MTSIACYSTIILTILFSSSVIDLVLVTVIIVSHKVKFNPDNMATPMAASIGDVVSLLVLSTWAGLLYEVHGNIFYSFSLT